MSLSKKLRKYTTFLILAIGLINIVPCEGGSLKNSIENQNDEDISDDKELPKNFDDIVGKDFFFTEKNGKNFSFKKLKDKIVLVGFSATWCPNCPVVLKSLDTLKKKIKKANIENIEILALNIGSDNIDEIKEHYKNYDINELSVYKSFSSSSINGIEGVPICFLFDKKGKTIKKYLGWHDFAHNNFIKFLNELSKKAD